MLIVDSKDGLFRAKVHETADGARADIYARRYRVGRPVFVLEYALPFHAALDAVQQHIDRIAK